MQIGAGGTTGALSTSSSITDNATLVFNRSNTITQGTDFASVISGTGAVTQVGSGTLVLTGTNTYTGATTVSAGTLQIGAGGTTGALSTSSSITDNATLVFNRSNTITQGTDFASVISGSGGVTQAGSGTLVLNGANTYTGTTTVSSGVVNIQNANALGSTAAGTSVSSGAALQIQGGITTAVEALTLNGTGVSNDGALRNISGSNTYAGLVTLGSGTRINSDAGTLTLSNTGTITGSGLALAVGGSGNTTINSVIGTGTGTLTKDGSGTVTLTAANTYTGSTTISAGTLQVNGSIASGSTVAVGTSGTLSGSGTISGNATLTGGGVINLSNPGVISGTLAVTGGNWNGAGSVNGTITSSSGTLLIGHGANLTANGGLNVTSGQLWSVDSTSTITGSVNYSSSVTETYGGAIAGSGSTLTMNNASSILTLTSGSSYGGGTNIVAGVVAVGYNTGGVTGNFITGGVSSSLGTGTVNISAGASLHLNQTGLTIANNIVLNGMSYGVNSGGPAATNSGPWNGAIMGDSVTGVVSNTITGSVTLNATSNITTNWNDKTLILAGKVTGLGGLVIDNSAPTQRLGSLIVLSNTTNDYQGDTTVNNGNTAGAQPTLIMGAANALPSGAGKGNLIVNGNFDLAGYNQAINGLSGVGSVFSSSGSATLSVGNNSASSTFSGSISDGSGTMAITKVGGGTLVLSGSNSYSGATTVSAGILNIQNATALGTTAGSTSVSNGATLQLQGGITVGAEALTLNGGSASGQTGALVNVSGTNTYAGAITVASSSSISAASGSVLNLTGGVVKNGTVATFNGGGTINVGTVGISGSSANSDLVIDGTTVNLNVADTYNGPTYIRNGATLNANVANALPTANGRTAVTFDGTGTSTLALGADQSVASLNAAGAATVTLNGNTLTIGTSSGSSTFAGSIGGTGGLIKDGASTQTLSGTNSYTGATTISAGALSLIGSIAGSSLTTINGGTLMGTGTVGAIQLNSGGALNPGGTSSAGTLHTGNISIVDGQLVFNLGGTSSYGSISSTGTINLAAGGSGAKLVLNAISGYAATLGDSFTLATSSVANAITGAFSKGTNSGTTVVTLSGVDYVQGLLGSNYYGRINYSGGSGSNLVLTVVTPVLTLTQSGSSVAAGGTYSFGNVDKVVPAVPLTKTFTIQNTGGVDLMSIVVNAPTGAAAADYTIDLTGTASTLAPGASTTFTVTFNPSRIGTRVAAIAINSNDLTNNPYSITLTGVGSVGRDVQDGWTVAYAGPDAPGTPRSGSATAVAVQKSSTSDAAVAVFATGYTTSANGGQDIYTAKYDPLTGNVLWAKTFNGAANLADQGTSIVVDSNGDVVITGYTSNTAIDTDVYVAKYANANGALLWQKIYAGAGGSSDAGASVAVDSSGNVAVAGYGVNASAGMDIFAARYSGDGTTTYFQNLIDGGSNHTDQASAVAVDSSGNLAVAGYVRNAADNKDFRVMKLDAASGSTLWQYTLNGSGNADDGAYSVAFDASGEAAATGYVHSTTSYDLYTVKLSSAGAVVWQREWDSSFGSSDSGYHLVIDSNGDVVVGGTSYRAASAQDGYVAKYSGVDGSTVWDWRFNGAAGLQDLITWVDLDAANNVVATGYSQNAAVNYDVLTAKLLSADGSQEWLKLYDGAAGKDDSGAAVAVSPDGHVYVGGYTTEAGGTTDFLVKNYQAVTATVQASQTITFANPGTQAANAQIVLSATASSGLKVSFSVISGAAQIDASTSTLSFTGSGNVTVRASQSGSSTYAAATSVDQTFAVNMASQTITFTLPASLASTVQWPLAGVASSGLAVSYNVQSGPGSISNGVLSFSGGGVVTVVASQAGDARYNAATSVSASVTVSSHSPVVIFNNIMENWRDLLAGSGAGQGNDLVLQLSGNEAVAGFIGGYTTTGTGKDMYLAKYLENGTLVWSFVSGTTGDDEAMAVNVDGNGDLYVAGYVTTGTGQDIYVAKFNGSSGSNIWSYTYNGAANGNDVGVSLDFEGTSNVVVGGYAVGSGTSNDFFAAKLSQSTGAVVWTSVQNHSGASSDVPAKVVVGSDGSAVLAGITASDAWTVKLAAADGSKVWQQVYNYANKPDAVRGLALDAANNVYIAAYSQAANYDMYTAKYAAADGTLIWGIRYNSSYNSSDAPWDMSLDQNSNVYVTGTSYRSSTLRDAMTLKYAGLDGTLQWQSRFNISSGNDESLSISIDGVGNPVVGGYATNSNGTTDVNFMKCDKDSGSNRWQATFDGGSNKNDNLKRLRTDPNGNVWMTGSTTNASGQLQLFIVRNIPTP